MIIAADPVGAWIIVAVWTPIGFLFGFALAKLTGKKGKR